MFVIKHVSISITVFCRVKTTVLPGHISLVAMSLSIRMYEKFQIFFFKHGHILCCNDYGPQSGVVTEMVK